MSALVPAVLHGNASFPGSVERGSRLGEGPERGGDLHHWAGGRDV